MYRSDYQHPTYTSGKIPPRQVTMSNGYAPEYEQYNNGYRTQPPQHLGTGRHDFDNQIVKNSNECYNAYDSLVDYCSRKFCQEIQFDSQQCQTRLHAQPVKNNLDTNHSGQISNNTTENKFINDLFDPTDPLRTNFTTPEPAIAYRIGKYCDEVERSFSLETSTQDYPTKDPIAQGIAEIRKNLEFKNKKPKAHSVALLDDKAITISFGWDHRIQYAILNLADLSHINSKTVDESPYLRQLERTPMHVKSAQVQIAGNIVPRYCYCIQPMIHIQTGIIQINLLVSRQFDDTITLGRDFASWYKIGISLAKRRVFFPTIFDKPDVTKTDKEQIVRTPKIGKTKHRSTGKYEEQLGKTELKDRGGYNIPVLGQ